LVFRLDRRAQGIGQFHDRCDRGVEVEPAFDIIGNFLDGPMNQAPEIAQLRRQVSPVAGIRVARPQTSLLKH
jgi:hypothetical protein